MAITDLDNVLTQYQRLIQNGMPEEAASLIASYERQLELAGDKSPLHMAQMLKGLPPADWPAGIRKDLPVEYGTPGEAPGGARVVAKPDQRGLIKRGVDALKAMENARVSPIQDPESAPERNSVSGFFGKGIDSIADALSRGASAERKIVDPNTGRPAAVEKLLSESPKARMVRPKTARGGLTSVDEFGNFGADFESNVKSKVDPSQWDGVEVPFSGSPGLTEADVLKAKGGSAAANTKNPLAGLDQRKPKAIPPLTKPKGKVGIAGVPHPDPITEADVADTMGMAMQGEAEAAIAADAVTKATGQKPGSKGFMDALGELLMPSTKEGRDAAIKFGLALAQGKGQGIKGAMQDVAGALDKSTDYASEQKKYKDALDAAEKKAQFELKKHEDTMGFKRDELDVTEAYYNNQIKAKMAALSQSQRDELAKDNRKLADLVTGYFKEGAGSALVGTLADQLKAQDSSLTTDQAYAMALDQAVNKHMSTFKGLLKGGSSNVPVIGPNTK